MPSLAPLTRARRRVRADLAADPYLGYVLLGALVLAGFGSWQRIPNFATWDARDRLLDPLVAYAHVLGDPGLDTVRTGVAWGREPFGATFYLYGLAVLPVVAVATAVPGSLDALAGLPGSGQSFGFYQVWAETPRWVWTWSIAAARLVNVALAVGCVYLTYRLGVALQDRATGRLAATLLALSFGFLQFAHEVGEDVPALFAVLLSLYLLVRYVQTGGRRHFYEASAVGGFALALKLTAAPIVAAVGLGYVLRARASDRWPQSLWRPRLCLGGAAIGAVVVLLGFPTGLVGRFDLLGHRFFGHVRYRVSAQIGPDAPVWWWFLRGYLHSLGLPLFLVAVGGVGTALYRLRRWSANAAGTTLVAGLLALYVAFFATWEGFRIHHLLPTLPLVVVLTAGSLQRLRTRRPAVAKSLLAALLVTTGLYAGLGAAQYASMPRDEARTWLDGNASRNATVESYRWSFHEAAVPHWMGVSSPHLPGGVARCPRYVQVTYADLLYLRDVPAESRTSYISSNISERAGYLRELVDGGTEYRLVAEFGRRPPNFVPRRPTPGSVLDVVELGIDPHSNQYGDEQDLRGNQYTAIFERTGACGNRSIPW